MSAEENNVVDRFWREVVNRGNLGVVDELFAHDCVVHDPVFGQIEGRAAVKEHVKDMRTLFPDVRVTPETQLAAAGSHVVTRWTATGTHTGQIGSTPPFPTGKRVEASGMSLSRVIDDCIEETWIVTEAPPPPSGPPGWAEDFCRKFPWLCR